MNIYEPVEDDCEHQETYPNRESCLACGARYKAAGHASGLGVDHIWTNMKCPAYRTFRPVDCDCGVSAR